MKYPILLAKRICTIAESNAEKLKNLENSKSNLSKYHYPDSLIKQGFQKALSVSPNDLRKLKKPSITLMFIVLLSPWLIARKIRTLAVFKILN